MTQENDGQYGQHMGDTQQYQAAAYQQNQQAGYQQNAYQQGGQYQQQYTGQPGYQPQQQYPLAPQAQRPADEPTTTGMWVLWLFLMTIPVVNIVLLCVFAFGSGSNEISRRNWARAQLIWMLVAVVVTILAIVVFGVSLSSLTEYAENLQTV